MIGLAGSTIVVSHGCAYGDGESYCAMAMGHRGFLPFSRRVLAPAIVRLMSFSSVTARFRVLDLVSLVVAAVLTAILTRRVARSFGSTRQLASAGAVIAAAVVLLSPYGTRLALFDPVTTDLPALALGLGWLVLATGPRGAARWWAVPVGALAVLAREAWCLPIVAGAVASLALPEREVRPVAAQVVAAGAAGVFALTRPGTPLGPSSSELGRILLQRHFGSAQGLVGLGWAMLFALGLFPLLLLALPRVVKARETRALVDVLVVVAAVHLLQSLVGATDTSRPAAAALPVLAAIAIGVAVAARSALALASVIAASLVVWQPFLVLHGSPDQYFRYCCPQFYRQAGSRVVSTSFALLVVVAATAAVAAVAARRRAVRP
ncbi:MAG: hypothetical protein JO148_12835 [Acidimicrobiia bacterium]|nr:hypothetical protein [Acidimicrobiia bacterium]